MTQEMVRILFINRHVYANVSSHFAFFLGTTAEFRFYFEKYGKVISAEVMFNRETHKSRGFGFIVFETENSAVKVCQVKEHIIDGKVVRRGLCLSFLYFFLYHATDFIISC